MKIVLFIAIGFLTLTSCKKNDLSAFQPEIVNNPDSFLLQATGLDKVTDDLTYTWSNSGTVANIDQSSVINSGTANVTIEDSQGTEVYNKDLSIDGSFSSSTGVSGNWTIKVDLTKVNGDLNFSVQKS